MIRVKKEEAFSGIIQTRDKQRTLIPCHCPSCGAIFVLHTDVLSLSNAEGPCPSCNYLHNWRNFQISPMKYKFMRAWRTFGIKGE